MNRTLLSAGAIIAISAGLLLSACGGSGSDTPHQPTAPFTLLGSNAPKFTFPGDLTIAFKGFESQDSSTEDLLRDSGYAITSMLEEEATVQSEETVNFQRYWAGAIGSQFASVIIARERTGDVITGIYRYYNPDVTPNGHGAQVVSFCEDQREGFTKNVKTGKVAPKTSSLPGFNAWSFVMVKDSAGDWQVTDYSLQQGVERCQVGAAPAE